MTDESKADKPVEAPVAEVPAEKPAQPAEVVSMADFKKLQATYDTRFGELTTASDGLKKELTEARAELTLAKAAMPKDQADWLKRERELQLREASVASKSETLTGKELALTARELLATYKVDGLTVPELVKLGSTSAIELAVLRAVTAPKTPLVPATGRVDQGAQSAGGALSDDQRAQQELDAAKQRK